MEQNLPKKEKSSRTTRRAAEVGVLHSKERDFRRLSPIFFFYRIAGYSQLKNFGRRKAVPTTKIQLLQGSTGRFLTLHQHEATHWGSTGAFTCQKTHVKIILPCPGLSHALMVSPCGSLMISSAVWGQPFSEIQSRTVPFHGITLSTRSFSYASSLPW